MKESFRSEKRARGVKAPPRTTAPPSQVESPAQDRYIQCGDSRLPLNRTPLIMAILNVTPDSFSDGGRFLDPERAIQQAWDVIGAGADILDIGGESTRPGSTYVSAGEELDRVLPIIEALNGNGGRSGGAQIPLSIDTRKPEVADEALKRGCQMVNDISAAEDPRMVELLARDGNRSAVVVMHKQGDPKTMQRAPHYKNVVNEVTEYLGERAESLVGSGIAAERIVLDPGIGFGKRFQDNLELMNNIDSLRSLGYPVLVGASRKAFLGELLGAGADDRLEGNLAVAARCYEQRVEVIRVHDVRETARLFRVLDAMERPTDYEADW